MPNKSKRKRVGRFDEGDAHDPQEFPKVFLAASNVDEHEHNMNVVLDPDHDMVDAVTVPKDAEGVSLVETFHNEGDQDVFLDVPRGDMILTREAALDTPSGSEATATPEVSGTHLDTGTDQQHATVQTVAAPA